MWYPIYKTKYGILLEKVFVREFREAFVKTLTAITEAVVGVQFNNTALPADIPQVEDVAKTLVDAVSNPNNTFNITVLPNSIQAALATTATSATTTANTTTTLPNTASTPTTTATAEGITRVKLVFKTKEIFTSDLQNLSSSASLIRTSLIDTIITPIYQSAFSSFRSLQVTEYSNGSIKNSLKLGFASTSVPNNTQIGQLLIKKAPNITAFIIDTNSVFVNDTQVSSGVSHKISVITASCLVLLSWLLTNQQ
ncbi:myb-like protein X [Channa argus]|uniref:myb-like protein X n=1 Tax=Channa argus TaxID=215402 RepID=UPI003522CEE8